MKTVAATERTTPPAMPSGVIDAAIVKNAASKRATPSHTHHGCLDRSMQRPFTRPHHDSNARGAMLRAASRGR